MSSEMKEWIMLRSSPLNESRSYQGGKVTLFGPADQRR